MNPILFSFVPLIQEKNSGKFGLHLHVQMYLRKCRCFHYFDSQSAKIRKKYILHVLADKMYLGKYYHLELAKHFDYDVPEHSQVKSEAYATFTISNVIVINKIILLFIGLTPFIFVYINNNVQMIPFVTKFKNKLNF